MKRRTKRAMKSLLMPIHSFIHPARFRNKVQENRYHFLRSFWNKYPLPTIKASLWNGTALHLLELSGFISRDMHRAAHHYFQVSDEVLQTGPQRVTSQLGTPRRSARKPFYDRPHNMERELKTETQWWNLTKILEEEGVKKVLDNLKDDRDLPTLEYLMETELALSQLQKGLHRLQNYLGDARV